MRKGNSVSGRRRGWTWANQTKTTFMQHTAHYTTQVLLPAAST